MKKRFIVKANKSLNNHKKSIKCASEPVIQFDKALLKELRDRYDTVYVDNLSADGVRYLGSKTATSGVRVRVYPTDWDYETPDILKSNDAIRYYLSDEDAIETSSQICGATDDFETDDFGFGYDMNGEPIDESTVEELERIANEIIMDSDLSTLDPYVNIIEDTFDYYGTQGYGANVSYKIDLTLSTRNIPMNIMDDNGASRIDYFSPFGEEGKISFVVSIHISDVVDVKLDDTTVDLRGYDEDKICDYVKGMTVLEEVAYDIHSTVSNI